MLTGAEAIRCFEEGGTRLFVGVPDSLMKGFCNALDEHVEGARHVVTANEGLAVATAAGHFLATGEPAVVYMQNSGLGNAVNPLSSLTSSRVYGIPMVLLIGWRGEPGVSDEPQHGHQGEITPGQLELLDIPTTIIGPDSDGSVFEKSIDQARTARSPVALLVRKGTFEPLRETGNTGGLKRIEAIELLLDEMADDTAFVATTGYTGRELAMLREKRGESWASDFLMVGSMGHASAIALGVALADPSRPVCCLDGDGAAAMHMGALAVIGAEAPANLFHVVLNNRVHESVGGQPSALRHVDLPALARTVGYADAAAVSTLEQLTDRVRTFASATQQGPTLIEVGLATGTVDGLPRPSDFDRRLTDMRSWLSRG